MEHQHLIEWMDSTERESKKRFLKSCLQYVLSKNDVKCKYVACIIKAHLQ